MKTYWYNGHYSDSPLKEALVAITGKEPPFDLSGVYSSVDLDDHTAERLGDWCTNNTNPVWAPGDSILEAAEILVKRAVENANIAPREVLDD